MLQNSLLLAGTTTALTMGFGLVAALWLAGCVGTDVGNPSASGSQDADGGSSSDAGGGDAAADAGQLF